MYKVRSIYSHTNTGGVEVDCPMCLGVGKIKPANDAIKEITEKSETIIVNQVKRRGRQPRNRDLIDG
jgi:hypothetical protein